MTVITSLVENSKGKIKNFTNHLNNLIKSQIQHENPDKPYKSKARPSREKANKSNDMYNDENDGELELDLEIDKKDEMKNEMLVKKRLRPRKNKVNYLEMEQGKL